MLGLRFTLCVLIVLGAGAAEPRVLFLSHDGLGADQLTPRTTPHLWKLAAKGWRGSSVPPQPSTTFNGHATLATGCHPQQHGIVANSFVDPVLGYVSHAGRAEHLEREPLWVAATRSGVRTAVYHWVCGEAPWRGQAAWRQEPFRSGAGDREAMAFCDQALTDGARLVMAYFPGTDEVGHVHGPGSRAHLARLRAIDAALGPWLEGLKRRHSGLRIVFTADHGMAKVGEPVALAPLLQGMEGRWIAHGRSATLNLADGAQAAEALGRLRAAGLEAWPSSETLAHPRAGQVLVQAPAGRWLSGARTPEEAEREAYGRAGAHGSMRDEPPLRACLFILGAGKGELGSVSMAQVAPTVAAWLGVTWSRPPAGMPLAVPPAQVRPAR